MNPFPPVASASLASPGSTWWEVVLPPAFTLPVKALVLLAVAGNLTVFAVAIRIHFARTDGVPTVTRVIAMLGTIFGVWLAVVIAGVERWLVWRSAGGLALCAGSLWLFVATLEANRQRPLSLAGA